MSDLDLLHEVGQFVRPPAFQEIVEARRRRTRRTRVLAGATLAVAASVAVGVLLTSGGSDRAEPPIAPTPKVDFQIPAGQKTITPEIRAADVYGYTALATVTNSQPAHRGDTYLSATATVRTEYTPVTYYCRSHDVPTWIAFADGDVVADSPGAATDGWTLRPCHPGESTSLAPTADLGEYTLTAAAGPKTVRMFAIAPPSAATRACLASDSPSTCLVLPEPIAATDAEFGFRLFEHEPARLVLELFEDAGNGEPWKFEALSSIDGVGWLVDRAVVADPESEQIAFELPGSDEYVVDVYVGKGPRIERCIAEHPDEIPPWETTDHLVYEKAVDKVCGVGLRLTVDGTAVDPRGSLTNSESGHFEQLGAHLTPDVDHQVVVDVIRGDPRNIRYAVVVRTRTALP